MMVSKKYIFDADIEEDVLIEGVPSSAMPMNRSFGRRLFLLERNAMHSQYLLACLSTLGGAHHLCNKPIQALQLAINQEAVGKRLGSTAIVIRRV